MYIKVETVDNPMTWIVNWVRPGYDLDQLKVKKKKIKSKGTGMLITIS